MAGRAINNLDHQKVFSREDAFPTSPSNTGRRRLFWLLALLFSLVFHAGTFFVADRFGWLLVPPMEENVERPTTVKVIFPENKKPREVVSNQNYNDLKPTRSDLLAKRNSRAANPRKTEKIGTQPYSRGNTSLRELQSTAGSGLGAWRAGKKVFNARVLRGESWKAPQKVKQKEQQQKERASASRAGSAGRNNVFDQQQLSVENIQGLTLSTYAWNWAPYIEAMKEKLAHVWIAPAAYYRLGLISGYTIIKYTVNKQGKLLGLRVLQHQGHPSLRISSEQAIEALFPFKPLPQDFPEETLTIIAKLTYPDVRTKGGR